MSTAESIACTDDMPSLYSVPVKKKMGGFNRTESLPEEEEDILHERRRGRSSSITFDLAHDMVRRNSSKKRQEKGGSKRKEKERKLNSPEKSPKIKTSKVNRSQGRDKEIKNGGWAPHNFDDQEKADAVLSMWACCKCTLENPLQETCCQACGGSRLCSIGDIQVT